MNDDEPKEDPAANYLDSLNENEFEEVEDEFVEPKNNLTEAEKASLPPEMHDRKWTEYVMKHFEDDELYDGFPTVDGLRRVVTKLLGPIVSSVSKVVQAPSSVNGFHATVEHTIIIRWGTLPDDEAFKEENRVFQDVADVCPMNTEPPYCLHSSSTAASKAEGRALRKALQLHRILAAEEVMDVPADTGDSGRKITTTQFNFIDMKCHDLNINAVALLNSGQEKYQNLKEIPYQTAIKIFHYLNQVQIGTKKAPENIMGYDINWKQKAGV